MTYGVWFHYHFGVGVTCSNGWYDGAHGSREEMRQYIVRAPLLSSSHREYTVQARAESGSDDGPNAICEQCKGPTRRVRDMLTVAEVWSGP